jgi:hypothetical protein
MVLYMVACDAYGKSSLKLLAKASPLMQLGKNLQLLSTFGCRDFPESAARDV